MKNWQICEAECLKYLNQNYSNANHKFEGRGGSDSTKSDILVTNNGIEMFYMESKMREAQCGQFVAFPNKLKRSFDYSNANDYPENIQSSIILDKMAEDFERYKNPGTKGIELLMDKIYFYSWICEFYRNKGVKYFLVEKEVGTNNMNPSNFVIFPIEHFQTYFDVSALYRRKKSGSSNPTKNDFAEMIKAANSEGFSITKIFKDGKYVFAEMKAFPMTYKIKGRTQTYQFKSKQADIFKVTRLSNTFNPNIIFSISLIKDQQEKDLAKFKFEFN